MNRTLPFVASLAAASIFLAACGGSGSSSTPSGTVSTELQTGSAKLQSALTTASTSDAIDAANAFAAASAAASSDPAATQGQKDQANFFGGAAVLALVLDPRANTAGASLRNALAASRFRTMGELMAAYGLGGTATDRSRLDTIRFTECDTLGRCRLKTFPAGCPSSLDVQAFLLDKMGSALQNAIASLGKVSPDFQYRLPVRGRTIDVDYTDALAAKAFAQALLALVQLQAGWNFGLDPAAVQASARPGGPAFDMPALLQSNPAFLTTIDAASVAASRTSALAAIASAKSAAAALDAETDDQSDDLITVADRRECTYVFNGTSYVQSCRTVTRHEQLVDFTTRLDEVAAVIGATGGVPFGNVTVYPSVLFGAPSLRSMLPTSWNAGVNHNLPGFFPDPTFGGFFQPAPASVNEDRNLDGSPDWLGNLDFSGLLRL